MKILIVEDDYISRSLLKKMLTEMGHEVLEAHNGRQGWDLLQKHQCRFTITDWMMPELDGVELCNRVRASSAGGYVYIIMLTARDQKKDLVHVLNSGADDYIPKPFDPGELRARVATGLRVLSLEERHKTLQSTLIESRNKLRIVFDALQELVVAVDPQLRIVSANRAFVSAVHVSLDKVVGQDCLALAEKADSLSPCLPELAPVLKAALAEGRSCNTLIEGRDPSGRSSCYQAACLPIRDEHGQVDQAVVVLKDVTEDHRKTEEIQALNQRLLETASQVEAKNSKLKNALKRLEETQTQMVQSEKMASIGQLAAGVAHEINNPTGFVSSNLKTLGDYQRDVIALLQHYRGILQALHDGRDTMALPPDITDRIKAAAALEKEIDLDYLMQDMGELIEDCREGTERIKKIVLDLKDFAHPGEDTIQTTDINKGLASTLNVVNNEIKYKATVHQEFGDIALVRGYPQQLNQVFMNVLVNAAQAIEKKGEIHIRTRNVDDQVEITIRDTGCGIAEENLSRIFDPFFTTKEVGKGTGLGMNIAYNIIQKHRGHIAVQSKVGQGTTFTIRLPADRDQAEAPCADREAAAPDLEKESDRGA